MVFFMCEDVEIQRHPKNKFRSHTSHSHSHNLNFIRSSDNKVLSQVLTLKSELMI